MRWRSLCPSQKIGTSAYCQTECPQAACCPPQLTWSQPIWIFPSPSAEMLGAHWHEDGTRLDSQVENRRNSSLRVTQMSQSWQIRASPWVAVRAKRSNQEGSGPSNRPRHSLGASSCPRAASSDLQVKSLQGRCGHPWWLRQYRICLQCRRSGFDPWVGKMIPWRRAWQITPVFLPGESHGQRRLEGYSLWFHKELDTTEWLSLTWGRCAGHS